MRLWKCRAVEIATRFPLFHSLDDDVAIHTKTKDLRTPPLPFRLILQ